MLSWIFCFVFRYGISYLLCLMRNMTMMLCVRMIWNIFRIGINQGIQCFKICHIFGIRKVTTNFENANNRWLKVKTDIVYLHYYLFIWKKISDPISKTEIVVKYLHFIFMFICLPNSNTKILTLHALNTNIAPTHSWPILTQFWEEEKKMFKVWPVGQ